MTLKPNFERMRLKTSGTCGDPFSWKKLIKSTTETWTYFSRRHLLDRAAYTGLMNAAESGRSESRGPGISLRLCESFRGYSPSFNALQMERLRGIFGKETER